VLLPLQATTERDGFNEIRLNPFRRETLKRSPTRARLSPFRQSATSELRARLLEQGRLAFSAGQRRAFGRSLACETFAFVLEVGLVARDDLRLRGGVGGFVGAGEVDVDALFDRGNA
jgi:hypothetical protein